MKKMVYTLFLASGLCFLNHELIAEENCENYEDIAVCADDCTAGASDCGLADDASGSDFTASDASVSDDSKVAGATVVKNGKTVVIEVSLPGFDVEKMGFQLVPDEGNAVKYFVGMESAQDPVRSENGELTTEDFTIESSDVEVDDASNDGITNDDTTQEPEQNTEVLDASDAAQNSRPTGFVLTLPGDIKVESLHVEKIDGGIRITFERDVQALDEEQLEDAEIASENDDIATDETVTAEDDNSIEQAADVDAQS